MRPGEVEADTAVELVEERKIEAGMGVMMEGEARAGVGIEGQVEADMAVELVEVVKIVAGMRVMAKTKGELVADMAVDLVEVGKIEAGARAETEAGTGMRATSKVEEEERTRNRLSKVLR